MQEKKFFFYNFTGIIVKYFGYFYVHFYCNYYMYLCVCIVRNNYLCVFIPMREFLYGVNVYVFIPMVLFIIKSVYA